MNFNEEGIQSIKEQEFEKAAASFTKAIESDPSNPLGYINFGNLLASMNDAERAERFYQKALTLDEQAATAYYGLANLYFNAERYEEAAKLYDTSIRNGMSDADAFYMLGRSFEKMSKPKLSLPYYLRAVELNPDDHQIKLSYAINLATLELFKEAEPVLVEIIDNDPANADAHYNLGVLYAVSTSRKEDAVDHLKKAFTIQPEHEQARTIYNMIVMK
ncbi:tetratricopeptide repeat protein [Chungangia koreensis]|uniref:Tetratricopeptide repeat protein n=1 Tax=Chungangia koreensis TaxID=752657 RepID=A0ABV8X672_9LACT